MTLEELENRLSSRQGEAIRYLCEIHSEAERWQTDAGQEGLR